MSSNNNFGFFRRRASGQPPRTIITFYDGSGCDARGRSLETILGWGAGKLELSHDYIQTLFPLPEASGVNDSAPIIDAEVFKAFRERPELRERLRDSFKKMLWFYGFELAETGDKVRVESGPNIEERSQSWNTRFDHNHLRITRIIRCLRVLGLEKEAQAFYETISTSGSAVSSRSREYWGRAIRRQLNLAPDLDDGEADGNNPRIGPKFLWEYEQQRLHGKKSSPSGQADTIVKNNGEGSHLNESPNSSQ